MNKHQFIFFILLALLSFSCSNKSVEPTKTDLISRTWQIDEATVVQGAATVTAYKKGASQNLTDLSKFRLSFSNNGTVTGTDANGVTTSGNWFFANNETQFSFKLGSNSSENATIVRLTSANLDFSVVQTDRGITSTVTFKMIPL